MSMINPWLADQVKALRTILTDNELQKKYDELYGETKSLGWNDFICKTALADAIKTDPFLTVHRKNMNLPPHVKEWLYWNNVDRIVDLIQISDEELRTITIGQDTYYNLITGYLSEKGHSLLHCPERTYKISSYCSILADSPARLEKWMINPSGTVHVFNASRPTSNPEWFDEFYRRYEFSQDEEKYCLKLVPVTVGNMYGLEVDEIKEFFTSFKRLWNSYTNVCNKFKITPRLQRYKIPENTYEDLKTFPLDRFIDFRKDVLRSVIEALEQTSYLYSFPLADYFEANITGKLDLVEYEKDKQLQDLLIQYAAFRMDFDNVVWYLSMFFNLKNKPYVEWPLNPWLHNIILEYRKQNTDEEMHAQYKIACSKNRNITWIDFLSRKAISQAIEKNPILLTPLKDMPIDKNIKIDLALTNVKILADLVQLTYQELNMKLDEDKFKMKQVTTYLKKMGFKLYRSDLLTYKIPVNQPK